jgi:hypothetical protein
MHYAMIRDRKFRPIDIRLGGIAVSGYLLAMRERQCQDGGMR